MCAVYREDAVTERICQTWFVKFRVGDTTLEDEKRSGRSAVADKVKTLIENNQFTMQKFAEILHLSHTTVIEYLHKLGYVNRLDV